MSDQMGGIRRLFGVVNDRDGLAADRRDRPVLPEEIQGVIGVEFALVVGDCAVSRHAVLSAASVVSRK